MRMERRARIKAFNLLEVVGAMLLIAFGITAVMGILQPSIRASRDSVGDNYCADVSSQVLSYLETKARQSWSTVVGTTASGLTSTPPYNSPTSVSDSSTETPESWSGQIAGTNIYTSGGSLSENNGLYGIRNGVDFSAVVRVWKKQIDDFTYGGALSSMPIDKAIRFHIEISYPASKPYSARERRFYSLEVFNQ